MKKRIPLLMIAFMCSFLFIANIGVTKTCLAAEDPVDFLWCWVDWQDSPGNYDGYMCTSENPSKCSWYDNIIITDVQHQRTCNRKNPT